MGPRIEKYLKKTSKDYPDITFRIETKYGFHDGIMLGDFCSIEAESSEKHSKTWMPSRVINEDDMEKFSIYINALLKNYERSFLHE